MGYEYRLLYLTLTSLAALRAMYGSEDYSLQSWKTRQSWKRTSGVRDKSMPHPAVSEYDLDREMLLLVVAVSKQPPSNECGITVSRASKAMRVMARLRPPSILHPISGCSRLS